MWIFLVTFEFIWLLALLALLELTFYLMPCQQQQWQAKKTRVGREGGRPGPSRSEGSCRTMVARPWKLLRKRTIYFSSFLLAAIWSVRRQDSLGREKWGRGSLLHPLLMLMLPTFDFGMSRRSRSPIVLVCVHVLGSVSGCAWTLFVPTVIWRSTSSLRVCRHNFSRWSCQVISQTFTFTSTTTMSFSSSLSLSLSTHLAKANKPFDVFIWLAPIDRSTRLYVRPPTASQEPFVLCPFQKLKIELYLEGIPLLIGRLLP